MSEKQRILFYAKRINKHYSDEEAGQNHHFYILASDFNEAEKIADEKMKSSPVAPENFHHEIKIICDESDIIGL